MAALLVLGGSLHRLAAGVCSESTRPVAIHAVQVSRLPAAPSAPRLEAAPRPAIESVERLPASLRGSDEDGQLRTDDQGDLVLGPEVLRLFDYYLSATGEEPSEAIRERIVAALHRRLPDARALGQVMNLLDRYLEYREATRRLRAEGEDLGARLEALQVLRRRSFGAAPAEQLFGQEERTLAIALAQRRILADPRLSPEQRATELEEQEARLPDEVRRARADATLPLRDREVEDARRAAGASAEDLAAYRTASFGSEAAERLAELDRRRAAWQHRLAAFRQARAVLEQAEPDPARRRTAAQALLQGSFTPVEQIRVDAADRMDAR